MVPVWVYPSKDKMAWFGAVVGAMCKQRLGALCGCKVWVYLTTKGLVFGAVGGCGAGLSYIQALAWCLAWC